MMRKLFLYVSDLLYSDLPFIPSDPNTVICASVIRSYTMEK